MAAADLGISLSAQNELANSKADIIILNQEFASLHKARTLAELTFKIIRENFLLSGFYNLITVPLAAMGYITPLWAAVLMPCSSLLVLSNSLQIIRRYK